MDEPSAEIACTRCGATNRRGEERCARCQTPLPGAAILEPHAPITPLRVSKRRGLPLLFGLYLLTGTAVLAAILGSLVIAFFLVCKSP